MPDYDEPVKDYDSFFKDQHARNVSEYFEDLVRTSSVDEQTNINTVAELRGYEAGVAKGSSSRKWWRFLRIVLILAAAAGTFVAIRFGEWSYLWLIPAVGALVLIFAKVNPAVSSLNEKVKTLEGLRDEKSDEAWVQMEPLNSLHTWDAAPRLFQKSFPDVKLDSYVTAEHLNDLQATYGLTSSFTDGRSVLFSQAGTLKNNPFVVTRYIQHWIGSYTYYGSLVIYWTENIRDANGNWTTVQRSQTLTASVTKPYPMYQSRSAIIYGHESAPNLSFSRMPSNLSGLDEGLMNNWRKDHAIKKVEKQARKAVKQGTSGLTVMSNLEFEALFNATDRDNEIEFRLLFTPLAQQEMVNLMNDKTVGYGDDFSFIKSGAINIVEPNHLGETRFDGDPRMFKSLELSEARKFFNDFHFDYFRSLYFAFAPLLTIPLYREKRTIPKKKNSDGVSAWEHEAMANYIGEDVFKHPESVTTNLLKTSASKADTGDKVSVTAFGFKGVPRMDLVPMLGGDGNIHQVPVHWTEYIPVKRQSSMLVGAIKASDLDAQADANAKLEKKWTDNISKNGGKAEHTYIRGALAATLL